MIVNRPGTSQGSGGDGERRGVQNDEKPSQYEQANLNLLVGEMIRVERQAGFSTGLDQGFG